MILVKLSKLLKLNPEEMTLLIILPGKKIAGTGKYQVKLRLMDYINTTFFGN